MFKGLGNFASLLRGAQQLQGKMAGVTEKLRAERVSGAAGAGLVTAEANGLGEIVRLKIDPQLTDREMLESLAPAAINEALEKSKRLQAEAFQAMAGGLDLAGLSESLQKMMPSQD